MRWLKFFLSHSLFVSCCAYALCYQSYLLLKIPVDFSICTMIFYATLGSYNFYWGLSKWSFERKREISFSTYYIHVFFLFISAIALLFYISLLPELLPYIVIATLLTVLYCLPLLNVKRKSRVINMGFLKTGLLAFTWTFVTVMFPAHSMLFSHYWLIAFIFLSRFLFLLILCIIFDLRDVNIDQLHGLHSIATGLEKQSVSKLILAIFIVDMLMLLFCSSIFIEIRQRYVLMATGILSICCYLLATIKDRNYYFYYFLVDGLMLFSAFASYIVTI